MKNWLKKSKWYIAAALFVQAITFLALFFVQWGRRRSLAEAFLAMATLEAGAGALILHCFCDEETEETEEDDTFDMKESDLRSDLRHGKDDDEVTGAETFSIPLDETGSEAEFQ